MTNYQKTAVVTGATRGIGLETTRQLAQAGVRVLLAGRNLTNAARAAEALQLEGLPVDPIALDVTDSNSIAAAAAYVQAKFGRLDILVNNAGVLLDAMDRKPSEQTLQVWRDTFDTNVFAMVEVTKAFLPLLKAAVSGRIVNLSSQLASFGLHTDPASPVYDFKIPAYNASKSVVNAWTVHLAYELKGSSIWLMSSKDRPSR
jgi:NAD(P)-dependent dehydrogenase (short-subunit alcohol dehydrogenase family)